MNKRRLFVTLLAAWLLTCCLTAKALAVSESGSAGGQSATETKAPESPELSAACAALVEVKTGRVLYTRNGQKQAFMASTTKVMTALLAVENGRLDSIAKTPDEAVATEGSKVYLDRGESMTLNDLLYGLMLVSGNDAAVTIAHLIGGSTQGFAELMNARAAELGCTGTHFVNPNGLPNDDHYTTAEDLAKIAATAMQNSTFRQIVGTTYHQTDSGDRARTFKNKNKILWQYEGGNGVKTGFTKAAGRCLVFSAEREGMTLVGVVLNAPDMWNDATKLLDYGFDKVENRRLTDAQQPLAQVLVEGGIVKNLPVYALTDICYPFNRDGSDEIAWQMDCADSVTAPVRAGQTVGTLTLLVNGAAVQTVPLIVTESVPCIYLMDYLKEIASDWCA